MADKSDKLSFDKTAMFRRPQPNVIGYRETLFNKFARNMTALLEAQTPKRYSSNRGLLDTRKLHRYQTDDNVFYKRLAFLHRTLLSYS